MNSSFIPGQVAYPISTHQVYKQGEIVTAKFWGSPELGDESVSFMLLRVSSLSQIKDVLDDGLLGTIETLFKSIEWIYGIQLDSGDGTHIFPAPVAGDYILVVTKIEDLFVNPKFYIYSATAIEVIDDTLNVIAPTSVEKGNSVNVNSKLSSESTGIHVHVAAMIKKTAYSGEIKITTDGTIPITQLYVNGELMADGSLFTDFFLGTKDQTDITIALIQEKLMMAFNADELAFNYTTATHTGSISLSTSLLIPGDYVLLVGAWKDFETRMVGVYQKTVTVSLPGIPVADAGGPYTGKPGVAITFNGANSYDPDGDIVSYSWDFGDETPLGTGSTPSHTYPSEGTYTVTLTVTDNDGLTSPPDTTTATISTPTKPPPSPPPYIPPTNKLPVAEAGPNQTVYVDELTQFSGVGSYDLDGTILFYDWDFGDGTTASGMNVSHAYSESGIYTANLTVMDDRIADGSDTCTITVLGIIPIPPLPPFLDNLNITPAELELGDNVTISFDIMNLDSQSITYGVDIHIENVNDPPPTWPPYGVTLLVDVELGAYEAKTVSHTVTMDAVGDFNVTVDGLTGSFTVETPEIPLKPAEFVVSYLHIKPEEVELGEGIDVCTFKISVDVTNVGERTGSHTVELKVDGEIVESGTVTLMGGEETSIVFDVMRGVGSYSVEVDGLTGSFVVKPYLRPLKPAEFEVSDLVLTPSEAQPGATITVSAKIANIGEMEGNYTLELKLDGETVETESVTLAGGTSQEISFTISSEEEGTHTVEVYELSDSFTVKSPPPKKPIWPLIVIAAAIIAVLVYLIWVRTNWIQQLIERMRIDGDVQELP